MAEESSRTSRSGARKELFGEIYKVENEFVAQSKLQTGQFVIGRMLSLCKEPEKGKQVISRDNASMIVTGELRSDWIQKNVYPLEDRSVAKKIQKDYETFLTLRKSERNEKKKKSDNWYSTAQDFNDRMSKFAYDIRTRSLPYQRKLETTYGVKMTDEDEAFYEDNCHGDYKAVCSSTVPMAWVKKRKRELEREQSIEKKMVMELTQDEADEGATAEIPELLGEEPDVLPSVSDPTFELATPLKSAMSTPTSDRKTRSSDSKKVTKETKTSFPKVKIRYGPRLFNENVIRCTTQCLSKYKVTPADLKGIIVDVANVIFKQDWVIQDESEDMGNESSDDEHDSEEFEIKRQQKSYYSFPSRRSLNRYLEDASYMNLEVVADYILNKQDSVVTVGLDDTTKAAGHKLYDVKADHITIEFEGPSSARKTFTTGYTENISHSGEDAARAYEFKLECLAVLSNTSTDEIKQQIDFWMSDRAGDCSTLLQKLGIDDGKVIKCSAHIILGVDHAIDKVFRDTEQKIGVQNLLQVSAGEKVFSSPSSSVHTLALIAIAKLLSPSHAAHSVSLYNDYITWMAKSDVQRAGFKGFVANRFGRIAELAKEFLARRNTIIDFFNAVVDVNANKLVLAVSTFIQCDWFFCCAEVYSVLANLIIFPLMDLLGIDSARDENNPNRSWQGIRHFFETKIPELEVLRDRTAQTGQEKLTNAVLDEVIETVNRQLGAMDFFKNVNEKDPDVDESKLQHAPLTNLGCESEFAKLDNRIRVSGGSTSVATHSRKNVVATNGLLIDSDFTELSEGDRRAKWKWARRSEEVQRVKKLEADFLATVSASNRLALVKKEELKKKKMAKTLKLLDICKEHSGPMTLSSLHLLDGLSEKQLLAEIGYLRVTLTPDIRQMRRIKTESGKFKMQKFTEEELRASIKNALKPEAKVTKDVDRLLKDVL